MQRPDEKPTDKQIEYAHKLAYKYGVTCPNFKTKKEASEWIDGIKKSNSLPCALDTYNLYQDKAPRW